jgi:hypothetical protein
MRGPLFIGVALAVAAAAVPVGAAHYTIATATATTISCKTLNAKYPHGVGLPGAHDKTKSRSGPVTNFTRNRAVYRKYKSLDRDHDGIACERH